ncbi:hypothetical protein E2C01_054082 [Portunus trituberculatus]|uniref:Uncharacterized protein n=1 Tax=Portunus trituberculatus TaxID=210409 RepID=A0A5B7GS80_PORTR|nr:hypothetical protein [Portunus trituberculatus]
MVPLYHGDQILQDLDLSALFQGFAKDVNNWNEVDEEEVVMAGTVHTFKEKFNKRYRDGTPRVYSTPINHN